jgi:hypothetical protein
MVSGVLADDGERVVASRPWPLPPVRAAARAGREARAAGVPSAHRGRTVGAEAVSISLSGERQQAPSLKPRSRIWSSSSAVPGATGVWV